MGGRGTVNGAYYSDSSGTPLPPPAVHTIPRGRGGGCCCCIVCYFLRIAIAVGVAVGLAALVIWLLVRPAKPRLYVDSASISHLNLTTGGTLDAIHVGLNISCRNPSKRMGVYYHSLHASANYRDHMIAWSSALPTFYQPHKNTTILQPILIGKSIHLPTDVSEELSSAYKSEGRIQMIVRIRSRIRLKVGPFKSQRYTMKVQCNMLLDGLNRTTTFGGQKCKVDF